MCRISDDGELVKYHIRVMMLPSTRKPGVSFERKNGVILLSSYELTRGAECRSMSALVYVVSSMDAPARVWSSVVCLV